MTIEPSINIENQEQLSAWVREQFQRANKYLAEQGILFDSVVTEESRYLAPYAAIWKMKALDGRMFWVTSGDVDCDLMPIENETSARAAMRHFAMTWQARAENIRRESEAEAQQEKAKALEKRAEILYALQADENFWQEYKS